jgi:biopolymer transport protein TolR
LQVGVPVELPESKGRQLAAKKQDPLVITVQSNGDVYIGEAKVALDEIAAKLKGIAKNGYDDTIFVKGDKGANYGNVLQVMGRIVEGGFTKVSFVSELEQGG